MPSNAPSARSLAPSRPDAAGTLPAPRPAADLTATADAAQSRRRGLHPEYDLHVV